VDIARDRNHQQRRFAPVQPASKVAFLSAVRRLQTENR